MKWQGGQAQPEATARAPEENRTLWEPPEMSSVTGHTGLGVLGIQDLGPSAPVGSLTFCWSLASLLSGCFWGGMEGQARGLQGSPRS